MIVQLYEDGTARVFDGKNGMLCDVIVADGKATAEADAAFKRIRMRRVGKWRKYAYFREAHVRFESPRKRPAQSVHQEPKA